MSYAELYDRVQNLEPKVKTNWIRDQIIDLTSITSVKRQHTGLFDQHNIRGMWIEGPQGPPVPLLENEGLIVSARKMDQSWQRIVYTKELMHAFDTPDEKADTPEKFDAQADRFGDPTKDMTPMYHAEGKALWRALGALCPEHYRQSVLTQLNNGEISEDVVAAGLKIPTRFIANLRRSNFLEIMDYLKQ